MYLFRIFEVKVLYELASRKKGYVMEKLALITGATRGIGKATALELAKLGYTLHIIGTNREKGEEVLKKLHINNSEGKHELFIVDLSKKKDVNNFLDSYIEKYSTLDVLMLNAGIFPDKLLLSEDGIDKSFSIGYISRYMFAVRLNKLLQNSPIGKVVHINGGVIGGINYDQLSNPQYKKIASVWQCSVGGALLVNFWQKLSNTDVAHMHVIPGFVDTEINRSQGTLMRFISKTFGMKPQKAGAILANHINTASKVDVAGKFFIKDKLKKTKQSILNGEDLLDKLIKYSESFTNISFK